MAQTGELKLYRRRLIPEECILLKDDRIVRQTDEVIVTTWNTLKPKVSFSHGCSCYFLKKGVKLSKFYRADDSLLYWYCDIVDYSFDPVENALTVTDLLADVIVYPHGLTRVVDLDELADALESGILTREQMALALRRLQDLLSCIYRDKFERMQEQINSLGL